MASNLYNQDFTFKNLTITGNLTLANDSQTTEILTTNLIEDSTKSSSIILNNNQIVLNSNQIDLNSNQIDLNANSINLNAPNGTNISNTLYMNSDSATIYSFEDLRITTASNKGLYLNNDKTDGADIRINSGCINCNCFIDSGDLVISNGNLSTNLIEDSTKSSNIILNSNQIDLNSNGLYLNAPNGVNVSNTLYINSDTSIVGTDNLRITNLSGKSLFINNDKSSGDVHINSSSSNSNTYIDEGNLIVNNDILIQNIFLNPVGYLIVSGDSNTYYLSQLKVAYYMTFVVQLAYDGDVTLYLDSAPANVTMLLINQMGNNHYLKVYNQTGNFYGAYVKANSNLLLGGLNAYFCINACAGGWFVTSYQT